MKKFIVFILTLAIGSMSFCMHEPTKVSNSKSFDMLKPTNVSAAAEIVFGVGEKLFTQGFYENSLPFLIQGMLAVKSDEVHGLLLRRSLLGLLEDIKTHADLTSCMKLIASHTFPLDLMQTQRLAVKFLVARLGEEFSAEDEENEKAASLALRSLQRNIVRAAGRNPDEIQALRNLLKLNIEYPESKVDS